MSQWSEQRPFIVYEVTRVQIVGRREGILTAVFLFL